MPLKMIKDEEKNLWGCLVARYTDCKLSTLNLDNFSINSSIIDKMKENLRHDNLSLKGDFFT